MIRSWRDRPKPVGFGCYGGGWRPRVNYAGTYNKSWEKERDPYLPKDFRFEYYNAAHPDLQYPSYLNGDEPIELINLSPIFENIRFNLPSIQPMITLTFHHAKSNLNSRLKQKNNRSLSMHLDTVYIFNETSLIDLIWRGWINADEPQDISEIKVHKFVP